MIPKVTFRPRAESDPVEIYNFISRDSQIRAQEFAERIRKRCLALVQFPEQGTSREDLGPGLRVIGFERSVTIAFRILHDRIQIVRIFSRGRHFERLLREEFGP